MKNLSLVSKAFFHVFMLNATFATFYELSRFLRMQLAEEQRQINLGRKNKPNIKHLNDELVTLQIQVKDIKFQTQL